MAQVEQVLVVPRSIVEEVGMFHGLVLDVDSYLEKLFAADVPSFLPRPEAEQDPTHKQLIPYVLIRRVRAIAGLPRKSPATPLTLAGDGISPTFAMPGGHSARGR